MHWRIKILKTVLLYVFAYSLLLGIERPAFFLKPSNSRGLNLD